MPRNENDSTSEPDIEQMFQRLLAGRSPRPLDRVRADLETHHIAPSTGHRGRRPAFLALVAAAVLVLFATIALARGHHHDHEVRTATSPSSESTDSSATTASDQSNDQPSCGPEVLGRAQPLTPQGAISTSYPAQGVADHFGDRFNSIWAGDYDPELGNNQPLMIAATHITDADRAWAATIPMQSGHIELVEAKYSDSQLAAFAARMKTRIPDWHLPAQYEHHIDSQSVQGLLSSTTVTFPPIPHSVYPRGLFNVRGDLPLMDGSPNGGEKAVTISVINCSSSLIQQAADIANAVDVPIDSIHITSVGYP